MKNNLKNIYLIYKKVNHIQNQNIIYRDLK